MSDREKIEALHTRLLDEQRRTVGAVAQKDVLPAAGTLARIAQLEQAIVAVETMLDDREGTEGEDGRPLKSAREFCQA